MKRILLIPLILLFITSVIKADIIFGVVPQQSPVKLLKLWLPITQYLSQVTDEKIIFKTEKSIPKFEEILYSGGYDFAYMNPYHYVLAHKKQNYIAEVRATKNIQGILVGKKGTKIDFKDKNNTFLFPAPNAFAATLLTKYDLVQKFGVDIETLNKARYVNSHDSVYKGVSRGIGNLGGGIVRTFNSIDKLKSNLSILHTTDAYPSHPFAFKDGLDVEKKNKIVSALLSMPQEMLQTLKMKKMKKIGHEEYKRVKDLSIKLDLRLWISSPCFTL